MTFGPDYRCLVVDGGSNWQGHKTHQGPKHGYRGIPWIYKREWQGKVINLMWGTKMTNTIAVATKNKPAAMPKGKR